MAECQLQNPTTRQGSRNTASEWYVLNYHSSPLSVATKDLQQWMIDYVASGNSTSRASMARPDSNSQQVFNVTVSRKPWLARLAVTMVDKDMTCGDIS